MIPATRSILIALVSPVIALQTVAHAAVVTTGCGGGATCTMTQLTGGGTITAGSLRFHSFSVLADFGVGVDESTITLTGLDDMGLDPGPGFRLNSNSELSTAAGEDISYAFSFSVTDVNGSSTMKDGSLSAGTYSLGLDDLWEVQARVPSSNFLPDLKINAATGVSPTLTDSSLTFLPTSGITVRHNIDLDSTFIDSTGASLDSYTFRVSQVPIPAALPLMLGGLGLLLAGGVRRSGKNRR